jgi:hypothetical protein
MSIIVYWSCLEDEWMRAGPPQPVLKKIYENFSSNDSNMSNFLSCPSVKNEFKNMFSLHSLYDYEFTIKNNEIASSYYDEKFFNKHVLLRSKEKRFFSFLQKFIFFTDADSLITEFYLNPTFENNSVNKTCIPLSGSFDIGKWFRHIEYPFFLREGYDTFSISEGDAYCYIKFNTEEKIIFKQFIFTEKIKQYMDSTMSIPNYRKPMIKLSNYYNKFNIKNKVLHEIKLNLI